MGCELYLIRHGVAEERGDKWPDDTKRPLTEEGMSRLRKSARGLAAMGVRVDAILTSSLTRARQTAEIFAAELERPPIFTVESLAPDGAYAAVTADLEKHARRDRLALVGHEPSIGELAARLIGSRHAIPFKKGAVCRIDLASLPMTSPGDLRWLLPPKVMRSLR